MTPKSLGKMTLADFEAAAARWEKAAKTIQKAKAVIGLQEMPPFRVFREESPAAPAVPPIAPGSAVLQTPEREEYEAERQRQKAEQQALLANLRNTPEHQAMLAQFEGEPNGEQR